MKIKKVWVFDGKPFTGYSDLEISPDGHIINIQHWTDEFTPGDFDGKGMIALAGLTDAHRHVWQSPLQGMASDMMLIEYLQKINGNIGGRLSAEELYDLNLYGYLRAQRAGITNIFDWCHAINTPEHADAAIQAAVDSGSNVLFFHGGPADRGETYWNNSIENHTNDIVRIAKQYGSLENVKLGMGIRGPEFAAMKVNKSDIQLAQHLNIPVSMHIGCSLLGKLYEPVQQLQNYGLLSSRLNMVHCNTLSMAEYNLIEENGSLMTLTPEAELQTGLGNPACMAINNFKDIKWSVGIDIPSGSTDSLLFQQRLLLQLSRGYHNASLIENNEMPFNMPYLANEFFFQSMEKANQYASFNVSSKIEVGKKACFSLLSSKSLDSGSFKQHPAFYYLDETNIKNVFINGKNVLSTNGFTSHNMDAIEIRISRIIQKFL